MNTQGICIAAGVIEEAVIRPDDMATVTRGGRRVVFGPCTRDESGRVIEPTGWEATEYRLDQDDDGVAAWLPVGYTYAPADAEMIAIAARYA